MYRSKRAAGIGRGTKYDFTKWSTGFPGPGKYETTKGVTKTKKFSFGLGRENIFLNGRHPDENTKFKQPGPGFYQHKDEKSHIGFKFDKSVASKAPNLEYPGPGQYVIPQTISKNGKYIISRFKDSGAPKIPTFNPEKPSLRFGFVKSTQFV